MSNPLNLDCLQTYIIPAGGSITIPGGAVIIYHDSSDASLLTTNCPALEDQLNNILPRICYIFHWETSGTGSAPLNDSIFSELTVGGSTFPLDDGGGGGHVAYSENDSTLAARITQRVNALFVKVEVADCGVPSGTQKFIVSVPEAFGVPEIQIVNPDGSSFINELYIKGMKIEGCTCDLVPEQ